METSTCDNSFWRAGFAWAFFNLFSGHTTCPRGSGSDPGPSTRPFHGIGAIDAPPCGIVMGRWGTLRREVKDHGRGGL